MVLNYRNKVILAPMVRIGTLPMRLACLENGADLVYTPEIVDKRIIGSTRIVNKKYGIIEYVKFNEGKKVLNFRTRPASEKGRLIFQLGTADPDLALQAALTVAQDVDGIDVNCGCPKKFSIHSGMGAALMTDQERLKKILLNLVQNCGLPVTCKIRIFPTIEDTLSFCRMLESTGIQALTVHCRTRDERPTDAGHWEVFRAIVNAVSIPVIANGDIYEYEQIARVKEIGGVSSVMLARGAQSNPSVFSKGGLLTKADAIAQYLRKCVDTDNPFPNTKYTVMQMADTKQRDKYNALQRSRDPPALYEIYGVLDYYNEHVRNMQAFSDAEVPSQGANYASAANPPLNTDTKRQTLSNGDLGQGEEISSSVAKKRKPNEPEEVDTLGEARR